MMKGGLGNMMKQAQKMQEQMQQVQEQVANMQVTGESGAGLVKVTLTGKHECKAVAIDPSAIDDDMEMLEDLVAAAINDASTKLAESSAEQMASVTNGMNLPPGFKMPF